MWWYSENFRNLGKEKLEKSRICSVVVLSPLRLELCIIRTELSGRPDEKWPKMCSWDLGLCVYCIALWPTYAFVMVVTYFPWNKGFCLFYPKRSRAWFVFLYKMILHFGYEFKLIAVLYKTYETSYKYALITTNVWTFQYKFQYKT